MALCKHLLPRVRSAALSVVGIVCAAGTFVHTSQDGLTLALLRSGLLPAILALLSEGDKPVMGDDNEVVTLACATVANLMAGPRWQLQARGPACSRKPYGESLLQL